MGRWLKINSNPQNNYKFDWGFEWPRICIMPRHGLVATIVVRQIFNEDKNLSQQIHEDKRQKDKC